MRPAVKFAPYAKSSNEKTGNIIMFAQFEEGNLLSETREDTESGKNPMRIQLCHQYLAQKKWMQWTPEMSQMMNLCIRT